MKLFELFNEKNGRFSWKISDDESLYKKYDIALSNGSFYVVTFSKGIKREYFLDDNSYRHEDIWEIYFCRSNEKFSDKTGQDFITGTGNSFEVFNAIFFCVQDFIRRYNPTKLNFVAANYEESRVKLYNILTKKLTSQSNWKLKINDSDGYTDYLFEKP